jgi:F-type H+-transporting ATPase subunit epsilon
VAATLTLDIVTPERAVFAGEVTEVVLPAWDGELGVLPGHDRLLALIKPGKAKLVTKDGMSIFEFQQGFAEIGPDQVTVFTDSCTEL